MKRSEANRIVAEATRFFADRQFALPPFADWSIDEWRRRGEKARGIIERGLGWDVTDFGLGEFRRVGLVLFTLRNGLPPHRGDRAPVSYAEKAMIVRVDQVTPMHRHNRKVEDIVNRGGGRLVLRLRPADGSGGVADGAARIVSDGMPHEVRAGEEFVLDPGRSVTVTPDVYHSFWAVDGDALVGEISTVNDDRSDNRFLEAVARFPVFDEDEPPSCLLVSDYGVYL